MHSHPRAEYEKILRSPSESFTTRRILGRRFEAPYHYHPEIEITWIVQSSGHRFVGDSVEHFHRGDLVLIGTNVPHVWITPPNCQSAEAVVVQFLPEFLGPEFLNIPEMRRVRRMLDRASRGLAFAPPTRKKVSSRLEGIETQSRSAQLVSLLEILFTLAGDRGMRPLSSPRYAPAHDPDAGEKIDAVYQHLATHFRETIYQADVARGLGLSAAAFSRFFRKASGRRFTATLTDIRLGHACELLCESDKTIAEICFECGFENLANFNRQFRRRHGLSPREWRTVTGRPHV